jgi:muramoyltetrapeptide carboxypeptidase
MLKPRALRPGDRLAVVSPASPLSRDEFDAGIAEIRRLGFEPVYDDSVFARAAPGYLSGSPELRANAIRKALADPAIAGIIGVRGGYGSAQLLPLLNATELRDARKPFIGYSDLTAILTVLTLQGGLTAFHGPTVDRLARGEAGYDRRSLAAAVCGRQPMGELAPEGVDAIRPGEARGVLLGGTVTQLLAMLATPYAFDPPPGYVLVFEEVGERPYRLDRMVTQLRQAGLLARASAVVIGDLPGCDEPAGALTARAVMEHVFSDFRGPVLFGFPIGHTKSPALTLPLGVECRVIAGKTPRLVIEEAAVE